MCNVCAGMWRILIFISMSLILLNSSLLHVSIRECCARWVTCSLVRARAVLLLCCALPVGRSRSRHGGSHRRALSHFIPHYKSRREYAMCRLYPLACII